MGITLKVAQGIDLYCVQAPSQSGLLAVALMSSVPFDASYKFADASVKLYAQPGQGKYRIVDLMPQDVELEISAPERPSDRRTDLSTFQG